MANKYLKLNKQEFDQLNLSNANALSNGSDIFPYRVSQSNPFGEESDIWYEIEIDDEDTFNEIKSQFGGEETSGEAIEGIYNNKTASMNGGVLVQRKNKNGTLSTIFVKTSAVKKTDTKLI